MMLLGNHLLVSQKKSLRTASVFAHGKRIEGH